VLRGTSGQTKKGKSSLSLEPLPLAMKPYGGRGWRSAAEMDQLLAAWGITLRARERAFDR